MAERKVFIASDKNYCVEKFVEFKYYSGFAVSQKQKCIASLHEAFNRMYPKKKVLEISTKSPDEIGVKLSAFNLMFHHEELDKDYHLENIFQSSKVFAHGGPYRDLLDASPKDAKRDERLKTSGLIKGFELYGRMWPLKPTTMFYDWIYIKALSEDEYLSEQIMNYDAFTDIEFNHNKSVNCQARAAAIFVSLKKKGELERVLEDPELMKTIYNTKRL